MCGELSESLYEGIRINCGMAKQQKGAAPNGAAPLAVVNSKCKKVCDLLQKFIR